MKITYDRKADAMNIKFQDGKYEMNHPNQISNQCLIELN